MIIDIYEDARGEQRWRFLASNGKTIADSGEGYKRLPPLLRSLNRIEEAFCPESSKALKFRLNGKKLASRAALLDEIARR